MKTGGVCGTLLGGGSLRMIQQYTWSGRERSSHSCLESVPKSGSPLSPCAGCLCPRRTGFLVCHLFCLLFSAVRTSSQATQRPSMQSLFFIESVTLGISRRLPRQPLLGQVHLLLIA